MNSGLMRAVPVISFMCIIGLFTSCVDDELAYDIIESPVLVVFDTPSIEDEMLTLGGTFYELDKSGILDNTVGIDSTLLSDLIISVYINNDVLIEELVTDASGNAVLSTDIANLQGVTTLEWAGIYNNVPFRFLKKF